MIYSENWEEKEKDRKDIKYTPKSKQLKDVICWDTDEPEVETIIKIQKHYER